MQRTFVGLLFGAACGVAVGVGSVVAFSDGRPDHRSAILLGAFLGIAMSATGAVVGGVADILKYLREALPLKHGPEADYREPDPPPDTH